MTKPDLLLVTSRLPYPPLAGDRLRSLHLIQRLSRHAHIHLLSLDEQAPDAAAREWLATYTATSRVFPHSRFRAGLQTLAGLAGSRPLQVSYFRNGGLRREVERLAPTMDLSLAFLERTAAYLLPLPGPKIIDFTDSIAQSYRNSLARTRSVKWRALYQVEIRRLAGFEAECVDRFDRSIFVNQRELATFGRPDRTRWIPNGVNAALFDRPILPPSERAVAFLGTMNYQPNVDAVVYFCAKVLPLLGKDVRFYIVGNAPNRAVRSLAETHPNVVVTGFLEDPFTVVSRCAALVAPMQTGGGIQNKILEAMAMGQAVITTGHGALPIVGAVDGSELLVADQPEAIAERTRAVLDRPGEHMELRRSARAFVQAHFTWDIFEQRYLEELQALLAPAGSPFQRLRQAR